MSIPSLETFQERRRHVRIDDDIVLSWREVSPDEIPETLVHEGDSLDYFPLSTQIKLLSLETGELLQRIGQDQPLLAEYLKILDRQVDILSRAIDGKQDKAANLPTRYVNLSASGLAFTADVDYPQGVLLELKIILPPSLTSIIAYGRVVDSMPHDEDEPGSFSMGVDFIRLNDHDRELLIRHVARRQALFREQPRPTQFRDHQPRHH